MAQDKTLDDLFLDTLKDIYFAEKQILKALPKMAKAAEDPQLKAGFEEHRDQTEGHVARLEEIFEMLGQPARSKTCDAILGIIENMSYYVTPSGERVEIFGHGGGRAEAERQKVAFLGEIPLFTEIRVGGDEGVPVVVSHPAAPPAQAFIRIAEMLRNQLIK